mmetsp:Transcript_26277/g.29075  ORF Transcript_26277/g.29075 Transcript_26277/m.29075 type:complete len:188 (-) Transcript_26277:54-617(-)
MAPTFAAFLADQNPGGRDFNAGLKLGGVVGSTAWIEKGGSSRSSPPSKDMPCRLAGARQRRHNDEIKGGKGSPAGWPIAQDILEFLSLFNAHWSETGVIEGMILGQGIASQETMIVSRVVRRHIVKALGVADKMHLFRTARKENGKARGGRSECVLKPVIEHPFRDFPYLRKVCRGHGGGWWRMYDG